MANPIHVNIPGLDDVDGHPIGVQVTNVAQNDRTGVPVFVINVGVLPGDVDNPRALFNEALRLAYTTVLQRTHQHPNNDDMVQFYFEHQNLTHGDFCSENYPIYCKYFKFYRTSTPYFNL